MLDEIFGGQVVVAVERNVGKCGGGGHGLDFEDVGAGAVGMAIDMMSEEWGSELHRVGCEEKATDGGREEVL